MFLDLFQGSFTHSLVAMDVINELLVQGNTQEPQVISDDTNYNPQCMLNNKLGGTR